MISEINSTQKVYEIYDLLRRADGVYSLLEKGAEVVSEKAVQMLVFYYSQADLFEAVFGRTSYIAKSRRDKETKQHLLDVIALTRDDTSIFDPFLKDASGKVFENLQAFTREIEGAYLHLKPSGIVAPADGKTYTKGERILNGADVWELTEVESEQITNGFDSANWTKKEPYILTDDKVEFITLRPEWFNFNLVTPLDTDIFEAIVSYVIFRWFTIVFPEEAAFYLEEYKRFSQAVVYNSNAHNRPLTRRHRMF